MTECPECGASFSMKYRKTYWTGENERTVTRTDNEDNPYTVTKYTGKTVHECESCGNIEIQRDKWEKDERDPVSKFF